VHLRLLADNGVIPPALRDAAVAQRLQLADPNGDVQTVSFVSRKAANISRTGVGGMLKMPRLYDVDRLDLAAQASLDVALQQAVTSALRELRAPDKARAAGLIQPKLLEKGDPAQVIYSFTLLERTPDGNRVRVQTDNFDQPFDINEGTKLDLGSTAKLRTLVNYLEIVAGLHAQYAPLDKKALAQVPVPRQDAIMRWALDICRGRATGRCRRCSKPHWRGSTRRAPGRRSSPGRDPPVRELRPARQRPDSPVRDGLRRSVTSSSCG
jgi:membrane peptidoglycan carboxypeptidase